jgi:hypothetical protein
VVAAPAAMPEDGSMATTEERAAAARAARESVVISAVPGGPGAPLGGVSWSGVWSGLLIGLGTLLLLGTLGLAIGVTAVDVGPEGVRAEGLGTGAAIWAGVSLLVALFLGGMAAARTGVVVERGTGAVQGMLVWVLAMLGLFVLGTSGISLGMNAVLGVGGMAGGAMGQPSAATGIDFGAFATNDVDRIAATLQSEQTVSAVSQVAGLPPDQARARLDAIRSQVEANRTNPQQAASIARQGVQDLVTSGVGRRATAAAQQAEPYATAAAWTTFAALVVSLLAAVLGGSAGARPSLARL